MLTAIIPMRRGSKGLPGKNTRLLNGKPLYQYSLEHALSVGADRIVISTDIPQIFEGPIPDGVEIIRRPDELCGDSVPMGPVLLDCIKRCGITGIFCLFQVTSPLRKQHYIEEGVNLYKTGLYDVVMSVTEADRSILKYGFIQESKFLPLVNIKYTFSNRQSLPKVIRPNGAIYIAGAEWFLKTGDFLSDRIGVVEMPLADSLDIDTIEDFKKCEMLLRNGQ